MTVFVLYVAPRVHQEGPTLPGCPHIPRPDAKNKNNCNLKLITVHVLANMYK